MSKNTRKNRIEIVTKNESCSKCSNLMERRKHKTITQRELKRPFYFSEWDYCNPHTGGCGMIQMYEKYKVWNRNQTAIYIKKKEEQENLFRNL